MKTYIVAVTPKTVTYCNKPYTTQVTAKDANDAIKKVRQENNDCCVYMGDTATFKAKVFNTQQIWNNLVDSAY